MNPAGYSPGLVIDPMVPVPAIILLGALLLFLTARVYLKVGRGAGRWRNGILLCLRLAGLVLVLLLLLQVSRQELLPQPNKERVTLLAVDSSLSMKQRDVERATRLDAAKNLLLEANVVAPNGTPQNPRLRLFEFSDDARPCAKSILELAAKGTTTRLNKSVLTMLGVPSPQEAANALIVLTDGHDFELVNPVKTGSAARFRQVPIYAVALGKLGKVRDVSVRITSFLPYCYVKQKARVSAALRLIGCEYEDLTVQLLRQGQALQTKRINADEFQELPVEFEVTEPEVGQYEYEIRVQPLEKELETANNSAITYLNIIDQQIRVLLVEGDPYWDTTFLQRSLMRNDKFNLEALVFLGKGQVRAIRKTESPELLKSPQTLEELARYDVVILGRMVDRILNEPQIALLDQYVKERSGTVIFARGRAYEKGPPESELEPVLWSEEAAPAQARLEPTAEGRATPALRNLNESAGGLETLPNLLAVRAPKETKPLTAALALAANRDTGGAAPAMVHRRYGRGQVLSVGVEGLWRWGLNAKADLANTTFDRYWDQMLLWLMAARDFIPTRQFSFRPNSANILLGEKVSFRLTLRQPDPGVTSVPLRIQHGQAEVGRVNMVPASTDGGRLSGEFLPERTGRYQALATFPDGTTQESRFIVYSENLEETEVATDLVGLRRLCESSGGRVIAANELGRLLMEINSEKVDANPRTRLCPLWNQAWVFYLAGVTFALDWFLRRRWGLC